MAGLSPTGNDRLFLLGVGLASCAVIGLMRQMLIDYRDEAVIPPSESKPQYITQEVEDSLKISTLEKLLESPNYCIQETASIIIYERALHDGATVDVLLWYITRPEHHLREKGIRALAMIMNSSTVALVNKPEAYVALVKSLEYSLEDYEHNKFDPDWDNWQFRDVVEQGCLMVLLNLVEKYGVDGLVKSQFVKRWLAKEPWGTAAGERNQNFTIALQKENHRLHGLISPLYRDRVGRKQLVEAGLVRSNFELYRSPKDIKMTNGEGTAGEDFDAMFVDTRRRRQSSGEEQIRRRNREAMVLNDGSRPVERADIIQRER